jgi:hypothetical protein
VLRPATFWLSYTISHFPGQSLLSSDRLSRYGFRADRAGSEGGPRDTPYS